jgi:hypothetical protein
MFLGKYYNIKGVKESITTTNHKPDRFEKGRRKVLVLKRIVLSHPWSKGGYDPLP